MDSASIADINNSWAESLMSNSTHGTKQPTTSSKKSEWSSYPQSREDSIKTIGEILQSLLHRSEIKIKVIDA